MHFSYICRVRYMCAEGIWWLRIGLCLFYKMNVHMYMYFSADYRHELTITSLKGCISKIEGSGNNAFAKAILDDLKKVLAGLTECDK